MAGIIAADMKTHSKIIAGLVLVFLLAPVEPSFAADNDMSTKPPAVADKSETATTGPMIFEKKAPAVRARTAKPVLHGCSVLLRPCGTY